MRSVKEALQKEEKSGPEEGNMLLLRDETDNEKHLELHFWPGRDLKVSENLFAKKLWKIIAVRCFALTGGEERAK